MGVDDARWHDIIFVEISRTWCNEIVVTRYGYMIIWSRIKPIIAVIMDLDT